MSKVLIDRELLVRLENAYMGGMSIYGECEEIRATLAQQARATRPAQTEQQPEQSGLVEPTLGMVQAACAAFRIDIPPTTTWQSAAFGAPSPPKKNKQTSFTSPCWGFLFVYINSFSLSIATYFIETFN